MKVASFTIAGTASYGVVTDKGVIDAGKRLKAYPTLKALLAKGSLDELKKLAGEKPDYALQDVACCRQYPIPTRSSASASTTPRIWLRAAIRRRRIR